MLADNAKSNRRTGDIITDLKKNRFLREPSLSSAHVLPRPQRDLARSQHPGTLSREPCADVTNFRRLCGGRLSWAPTRRQCWQQRWWANSGGGAAGGSGEFFPPNYFSRLCLLSLPAYVITGPVHINDAFRGTCGRAGGPWSVVIGRQG